jgi:hypothetical protein
MRHERHLTDRCRPRLCPHPRRRTRSPGPTPSARRVTQNLTITAIAIIRRPKRVSTLREAAATHHPAAMSNGLTMDTVHVVMMVMVATVMMVPIVPAIVMVSMPHRDFLDGRCDCDGWR